MLSNTGGLHTRSIPIFERWIEPDEAERRMILPAMIQECEPPAILAPLNYRNAVLLTQQEAIAQVAEALGPEAKPTTALPRVSKAARPTQTTGTGIVNR
jgi:hypothetical protein